MKWRPIIHDPLAWLVLWSVGIVLVFFTSLGWVGVAIFWFVNTCSFGRLGILLWRGLHGRYRARKAKDRAGANRSTEAGTSSGAALHASTYTPSQSSRASGLRLSTDFTGFQLAIGEVFGVRSWKYRDGLLRPAFHEEMAPWEPGMNEARCAGSHYVAHDVPRESCSCGFYAYSHVANVVPVTNNTIIVGMIAGSGRTVVGTNGFRCQKARIVALVDPRERNFFRSNEIYNGLRRNYPEVPMYASFRVLLKAHPLTPPPD